MVVITNYRWLLDQPSLLMKETIHFQFFALLLLYSCGNASKSLNPEPADSGYLKIEVSTAKQTQQDSLVSLLATMRSGSLNCEADIYWKIVRRGKPSIPLLIESLTDTTMTNVYHNCKQGKLTVGELSYFALAEIADFPAFLVTHIQFDTFDEKGCWSFYGYLFNNRNKNEYQKMVRNFYNTNKYIYTKYKKQDLTDCRKKYGIEGKYKLKE